MAIEKSERELNSLCFRAPVTTYTDTTHFKSTALVGLDLAFADSWMVYVSSDGGGAGAAPYNEWRGISDFDNSDGTITHAAFSSALDEGDVVLVVHPLLYEPIAMRGGAETLESIDDELDAMLDIAENPDTSTMTGVGTEDSLYDKTSTTPFFVAGVWFGLENMAAGDVIRFRAYRDWDDASIADQVSDDETWTYGGAQSPAWVYKALNIYCTYEFKITGEQLDGTNREIYTVVDDAARGS